MAKIIKNGSGKVLVSSGTAFKVDASIDPNITAGNIKDGVTILGVTGTYGGGGIQEKDVNFRDYDGTIIASYTAAEFANLASLPNNPSHEGLTAQGWNWTLANAKTFVAAHGGLEIGQMYVTDDGKTRLYFNLKKTGYVTIRLGLNSSSGITATIDWGDGSSQSYTSGTPTHTYNTTGEIVITISCVGGKQLILGASNAPFLNSAILRDALYRVELGNNIYSLRRTFEKCVRLQSVSMPSDLGGWEDNVFQSSSIPYITIPAGITSIGSGSFNASSGVAGLRNISLSEGLTRIGQSSFNRQRLTKIYIPDTVTTLGPVGSTSTSDGSVFNSCPFLEKVNLPSSLIVLNKETFRGATLLDNITLPASLTSIGGYAFCDCWSLTSKITIPSTVTKIEGYMFSNDDLVTDVYLLPTTPPTLANKNAFPSSITLHVPHGYLTAYQTASVWSDLSSQMVEMPE